MLRLIRVAAVIAICAPALLFVAPNCDVAGAVGPFGGAWVSAPLYALAVIAAGAVYHYSRLDRGLPPRPRMTALFGVGGFLLASALALVAGLVAYVEACPAY